MEWRDAQRRNRSAARSDYDVERVYDPQRRIRTGWRRTCDVGGTPAPPNPPPRCPPLRARSARRHARGGLHIGGAGQHFRAPERLAALPRTGRILAGPAYPRHGPVPGDPLDELAGALRGRLVDGAGDAAGGDDPGDRIGALVEREAGVLDAGTRAALAARVAERAVGLGPLEPLLRDPGVDEILVCGTAPVWVERGGRLAQTGVRFAAEADLRHVIERILAPLGRRADEAEPLCDARLPDGSRVNVVLPPLALDGPVLTIRRFRPRGFTPRRARRRTGRSRRRCSTSSAGPCARAARC